MKFFGRSGRFRRPTPWACRFAGPVWATSGEVLALADQPLVELADEQGDLGFTEVMAEGAAGEANLLARAWGKQEESCWGQLSWAWRRDGALPVLGRLPLVQLRKDWVSGARWECRWGLAGNEGAARLSG